MMSLSRMSRPCDDIMYLIGEAVSKHREFLTHQYHVRRYVMFVQRPHPDAMGDRAYQKQLIDNQNRAIIGNLMLHISADNRYFSGIGGPLPSDMEDPLPTPGEKGHGLFGWSKAARDSRCSQNKVARTWTWVHHETHHALLLHLQGSHVLSDRETPF